ncbi:MAG: tetratricopeptide repeat protein [Acidobacteria bacterium]|nr:tetratricopeptide repeat protein [Acidobacteriota bacterium]
MSSETVLHIKLIELGNGLAELRYYFDNPNDYTSRKLEVKAIEPLITAAETDYYTVLPKDLVQNGQKLFNWLDQADRFLATAIGDTPVDRLLVLAISTTGKLGHLPWETLHDGKSFLVESRSPRIVPVRWTDKTATGYAPANRPLRVLFMATSPQDSTSPLDFEREEALILDATSKKPLTLTVEESGNLKELHETITNYDELDVFHLTGHATHTDDGPQFLMESDIGTKELATGEEIAKALHHKPKLVFLSGCKTGQAMKAGDVPSMAETLLQHGFTAVLGWGRSVLETDASQAAAALYHELSSGESPTHALAATYEKLIEEKARDWHLLRLYVIGGIPQPLVTPLKTKGRKPAVPASVTPRFLDADHKIKVPKREDFVGRRRVLQRCLKVLRYESDRLGVVLHGMGGLGKSSLAARMCDRLHEEFTLVAWFGRIDEPSLVNKLAEHIQNKELRDTLLDPHTELKFKLWPVFEQVEKPFLLVLDDFEQNFETNGGALNWRDGLPVLSVDAVDVLKALAFAISQTNGRHRVIVTSRYEFAIEEASQFHVEPALDGLRDADWRKKIRRLEAGKTIPTDLKDAREHAIRVADGNPRLLEWLFKLLTTPGLDLMTILAEMDKKEAAFRESILAAELLKQQSPVLRQVLARTLVFDHPVPKAAIEAICDDISGVDHHLERAATLGLIEITVLPGDVSHYRVPRILLPLLKSEQPADQKALCQKATSVLYQFWWKPDDGVIEPQVLEIHRLAILGQAKEIAIELGGRLSRHWVNTSRFHEATKLCEMTLEISPNDFLILQNLAQAKQALGNIEEAQAYFQSALFHCPVEEMIERANILHNSASLYLTQGKKDEALAFLYQALAIDERLGDVKGKAASLHALAIILASEGRVGEAVALFNQSLEINEQIGNIQGRAATLYHLANLLSQQGQVAEALTFYQQALELNGSIGHIQGGAATLLQIATLHAQQGKIGDAFTLYQQAVKHFEDIGHIQGQASSRHAIAILYTKQGKIDEAFAIFQESLELFERIGYVQGKAATLHELARLFAQQGQTEKAIALYKESLRLKEDIQDIKGKALTLHELANIFTQQGWVTEALDLSHQSLELTERIGDVQGKAITMGMMAQLLAQKGEFRTAIAYLQESQVILEKIKSPIAEQVGRTLMRVIFMAIETLHGEETLQEFMAALESDDHEKAQAMVDSI